MTAEAMNAAATKQGIILFAHGARDARWAQPFERLRGRVQARVAEQMRNARVSLAFLEMMEPDLDRAADTLIADGCTALAIIPIFFGQGAHLRHDLPLLTQRLRERLPAIAITVAMAAGEDEIVLDAIADYCVRSSSDG